MMRGDLGLISPARGDCTFYRLDSSLIGMPTTSEADFREPSPKLLPPLIVFVRGLYPKLPPPMPDGACNLLDPGMPDVFC